MKAIYNMFRQKMKIDLLDKVQKYILPQTYSDSLFTNNYFEAFIYEPKVVLV